MKSNKEIILMYIHDISNKKEDAVGFTTQDLADSLQIQRSNISAILNELVNEEILEKKSGRPVVYKLKNFSKENHDNSSFSKLIGFSGSLKNAVQLAKAAILYPEDMMNTLIIGKQGTGKKLFSSLMYEYAKERGVVGKNAPFVKVDCSLFVESEEEFSTTLFNDKDGAIYRAQGGVLLIDQIDLISFKNLISFFETLEKSHHKNMILICTMNTNVKEISKESFSSKFPIHIEIPRLEERPFSERLELVEKFFMDEAEKVKMDIQINSELLRCFLLYPCTGNILQLQNDIKIGCANAYVRNINHNMDILSVYAHDCHSYIRKGFLFYKENRDKIESLIPDNYRYIFTATRRKVEEETIIPYDKGSIYDIIEKKVEELRDRNIKEEDIMTIVSSSIENDFFSVANYIESSKIDRNVLTKVVDEKIINLVDTFFKGASKRFNRVYSTTTFYTMCLYLTTCIKKKGYTQHLSNEKIMEVVEKYKAEYSYSMSFSAKIEKEFNVRFTMDEVIFITFFLCENQIHKSEKKKPTVLVVMHGNIASAIANTVNQIYKEQIIHAYDLLLEKDMKQAYEELKNLCRILDNGAGLLIIYDMGSIRAMIDSIAQEANIHVRKIEIPVTLMTLNCALKLSTSDDLDLTYEDIMTNGFGFTDEQHNDYKIIRDKQKVIITLCMTGKGSAEQIKQYLDKNLDTSNINIIAMAISDKKLLMNEISKYKEHYEVLCVVGTYDPKILNIPYISIAKIFDTPVDKLPMLLALEDMEVSNDVDFDAMYEYLQDQLTYVDINVLKEYMPPILRKVKRLVPDFTINEEVGLFMHISCAINRIKADEPVIKNIHKEAVLNRNKKLYHSLKEVLLPLEKAVDFKFNDDELATIVEIIK